MMAAPRFSPSGSRLHMMAAGPEKSAFSLPPTPSSLKLSGPAGSRAGFSCMPSAAAKRVPLRMAPASGYLESLNKGGSGGGGKQSGNCPICALVLRQIPTVCSAQRFFLDYANTRQHANILWNQHWGSFRIGGVMLPRRQVSDSRQNSNFDWLSYTQVAVAEAGAVEVMMPISPRTSSCCLQARTLQPVLCRRTSVQL